MTKDPVIAMRLDKWLWAARFYKTRALAVEAITRNRVSVNDQPAKPARDVRPGDRVELRQGSGSGLTRCVVVRSLSMIRGPAPAAAQLFEETPESIAARQKAVAEHHLRSDPAHAIEQGRPTKKDRRQLADWQRWSVSLDD